MAEVSNMRPVEQVIRNLTRECVEVSFYDPRDFQRVKGGSIVTFDGRWPIWRQWIAGLPCSSIASKFDR